MSGTSRSDWRRRKRMAANRQAIKAEYWITTPAAASKRIRAFLKAETARLIRPIRKVAGKPGAKAKAYAAHQQPVTTKPSMKRPI